MRVHGERFGVRLSARTRALTTGLLVVALSAGLVSTEAVAGATQSADPSSSSPSSPSAAASARPGAPPAADHAPSGAPEPSGPRATAAADAAADAPATDNAVYAYDAARRLVGVTDPDGETARYRYDDAGNRLGVDRYPSSRLSVLSLVPVRAAAGARITVSGTGFAPTPAANTVTFGGKQAEVVSASRTRLVVTVPAGAADGKVSVTTSGTTEQTPEPFALAAAGPSITKVDPATGPVGTVVTLTGAGFAASVPGNVVRFGGGAVAEVTERGDTSLTVRVPTGAVTGPIEVETAEGRTVPTTRFTVQSGAGAGEIEMSVTTSVTDPSPPTVAVTTPGNRAEVLFDADEGDDINLGFAGNTFNAAVATQLVDPQGNPVGGTKTVYDPVADLEFFNVPLSGRYSLILIPGTGNIGAVKVTVSRPVTPVFDPDEPTAELLFAREGQDGKLTFEATAGESRSLGFDATAMSRSTAITVYGPDGTQIYSTSLSNGLTRSARLESLPGTGRYTVRADPFQASTGRLLATLSRDVDAGDLGVVGPESTLPVTRPGQHGIARFTGQAGRRVSLGVAAAGFTSSTSVEVRGPDGQRFGDSLVVSSGASAEWDSPTLAVSGTYTVVMQPQSLGTGTLTLALSLPSYAGELTTTGAKAPLVVDRFGQDGEATFRAEAGDDLSVGVTDNTFTALSYLTVFAPSGTKVVNQQNIGAGSATTVSLSDLPESGVYRLVVDPYKGATGSLSLTLSADVQITPAVDGASARLDLARPGQRARAEFTAPDSGTLGFGFTANTMPDATALRLFGPTGGTGTVLTSVSKNSDGAVYATGLTAGATYTLLLTPGTPVTGALTFWLSGAVPVSLSASVPKATGDITRPGQFLRFATEAAAGDGAAVVFSESTLTKSSLIKHLPPGGGGEASVGSVLSTVVDVALRAPLAAGTHYLYIRPTAPTTGKLTATLIPDVSGGTLTVGGGLRPVQIATAGGNGHYTFTGSKGQKLTLGYGQPPSAWSLSVSNPDGTWLVNARSMSATTLSYALAELPADGTYTVTVDPTTRQTGTYNVGLAATQSLAAEKTAGTAKSSAASETTAKKAAQKTEPAPGAVPTGPDAWQPNASQLEGRDWLTLRGKAPKSPPTLRGPPGKTALTGHVLKLDGKPLAGVTVKAGKKTTRTDARGRFLLAGIDAETATLVVDGASANTQQRRYGRFDIHIEPTPGTTTDLGFPVWMTPLDTKHTVRFDAPAKAEVVLRTPKIPGLEVRIPKGSVVRDEHGEPVTELGITAIPIDRPPFPLPTNGVVPVYFTVQPGGTYVFPEGAQVIYPNYTREAPGSRVEFMDYDPKKKGWYVYGRGAVSADGRQVVPDAKTRIWAFHGAMFNISDLTPWDVPWVKEAVDWLSGDPVELSTGMLTDSRTDLAVPDALGSIDVSRTYWQGDTRKRAFGIGRDLSYNAFLHAEKQYEEVDLYLPGGAKVHFVRTSAGTGYRDAVFEPLDTSSAFRGTKILDVDGHWELQFRDGAAWVFPQYAALQEIRDRHGNTTKLTRLSGNRGELTRITGPSGRWISLSYDAEHRVSSAKDNTGRTTRYTYDTSGRLETVTDPAGKASRYEYDGTTNRIAGAVDARGITYMTNTFDADGRVKVQTLTEGAKYAFEYTQTGAGKVTSATVTQPGGSVRRVEFDADGYGVADTQALGSPLARKTVYERGPYHRIDAVVDPYARRTELTYDAHGYVTSATELAGTPQARSSGTAVYDGPYDQPTSVTDPLGNETTLAYDAAGDLRTVTDPEQRTTAFTHTSQGQLATVTDASGAVTEYTYDRGDLVSVKDAEGRTARRFLDAAGRPTATTDEAGARTEVTYDALNQPRELTDPLGRRTILAYDDNGNLTTLTDPRGHATTWAYDNADRPKSATDPLGAQALFGYDAAGRLTRATSRTGQVATAEYDLLGRPTSSKYGVNVTGGAESTTTYGYDGVDLPKTVTDTAAGAAPVTQSFTYDAYDRTKTVTGPTGTVGYSYDAADRRTEMTPSGTPAAPTTRYGYDAAGILTSVTTGDQAVTFALDAVGRERSATLPGGITRATTYDKTGTTQAIAYARGSTPIGDLTYTRDERSLQTGLTGSLASVALPAAETGAEYGKDNRLTTFNGRSFTYDAEGRLLSDGKRTYTWNARGELTGTAAADTGLNSAFTYDPLGTRSSRTVGGTTSRYLTDASNPLAEQSASGDTTATVATSGLDEYLTRTENGRTQVYLTDALGTVVGLADPDGTVATRYTYDPNGQPTATGAESANPYTFTGRENDGTGLLHYRNRYYDPETGRFISQDPIGYAGGTNLYEYALSSPTTYTDPSGNNPLLAACAGNALFDGGIDWLAQRLSGRKVNWGQVGSAAAMGCLGGMLGAGIGGKAAQGVGCLSKAPFNSFTADTPVLMADGTQKPIKDVRIGDKVRATDPKTGETGVRRVTALIAGTGTKALTEITLATKENGTPSKITATDGHPFWLPELDAWVDAGDLHPGQWLRTSAGTWTQITAISHRTESTTVYNLTVDDLHTYYAVAGETPVLVHNCGSGASDAMNAARLKRFYSQAEKYGQGGIKELQNGRIRFYGSVARARNPGEMIGRRLVREWDPGTDSARIWHETLDASGNVRIVRPDVSVTGGRKVHYMFDPEGNFTGTF
ncbi:RHS repeat-associated core domain-containing protein [Streptomyces sp. NPDC093085]|uniref:RHS repeat-associated core domain-containing protein n=1 Tax=Streptomyces sp. NPDC093085 TaxID=3155068 RepID=UPI00343886C0